MSNTFGPYSPVKQAGDFFFISGQVGIDPSGQAKEEIAEQTKQALSNLRSVVTEAGLNITNIVKTTVYLSDMADFEAMNAVYLDFFQATPRPARSTIAVKELPRLSSVPLLVEIEAVAYSETK